MDAELVYLRESAGVCETPRMTLRTWHFELFVVALALFAVAAWRGVWTEYVGAAAVSLTFAHAQVAERLREQDAAREEPTVSCNVWSTRYFVAKEVLWAVLFLGIGAYTALVGVGLFLAYTPWRRFWRVHYPLGR
jgi:hypothetical protein